MPKAIKHFLFCAGLAFASPAALHAQGVPTVDTQSITQQINQIERMLKDYGIQTDMLDKLVDQLAELEKQTSELQDIYAVLTGKADIQGLLMGGALDKVLDPKMTSILQAASSASSGDWSGLSSGYRTAIKSSAQSTMTKAGLDPARVEQMGKSADVGQQRAATQATSPKVSRAPTICRSWARPGRPEPLAMIPGSASGLRRNAGRTGRDMVDSCSGFGARSAHLG